MQHPPRIRPISSIVAELPNFPKALPAKFARPYLEEMKSMLGDPTYSDVAFVVKHVDDQAGGLRV